MVFEITFTNLSSQALSLGAATFATTGDFNGALSQKPGSTLEAFAGVQTIAARPSDFLSWLASGDVDIECMWVLPSPAFRFGVRLHFPKQVFGIGSEPSWEIMYDQNASVNSADPQPDWQKSGGSPADQYQWPTNLPLAIVAVPDAGSKSLSVAVTVQDPAAPTDASGRL